MSYIEPSSEEIRKLLNNCRSIAVVGLSDKPHRDSYRVAHYMQRQGYQIYPVNPVLDKVLDERAYPNLSALPEQVDLVNIFRRSEEVPQIVEQAIAHGAKALWLQLGVVHEAAAAKAQAAGLTVVMDRCIKVMHTQLCASD